MSVRTRKPWWSPTKQLVVDIAVAITVALLALILLAPVLAHPV